MNQTYSITSKGQVTIPKTLRDAIGLRSGGQAYITLLDSRTIAIKAPLPVQAIRESIGEPDGEQPLTDQEQQKLSARGLL